MRLGLYIFATLLLMAIVAAVTYTINPNHYAIELMGINFNFPVATWIVLPMSKNGKKIPILWKMHCTGP